MPKVPWQITFVVLLVVGLIIGFTNLFVLVVLSVLAPYIVAHLRATLTKKEQPADTKPPEQPTP